MAALHIRSILAEDEAHWRRLWTLYLDYYQSTVSEEVYTTTFSRLLSGEENQFTGLIALLDGRPIGLTHYLFHRHCWKVENVCYLQDLVVHEDQRGTGVGRALIEEVYRKADEANCPSVYWMTQDFNEAGRRLYDRVGQLTPFIKYSR